MVAKSISPPLPPSQARLAGTPYITYSVDSEGHTLSREGGSPLNQAVPLYKTFKHILQDMHTAYRSATPEQTCRTSSLYCIILNYM